MGCRQYTSSSHATTLESNKSVKNKGLQEEIVTKIGLYDLGKSTTLESNKSHNLLAEKALRVTVYSCANAPAGPGRRLRLEPQEG